MTPMSVAYHLRVRSGMGNPNAPNVCILDGIPQRPPLYLLIESPDDADALAAQTVSAAADAYRKARGSLTGALLAVARAAATVWRQSARSDAPCGLSALLIADNGEALLAQVEPSVCWRLRDGQLTRWPSQSVWLDAPTSAQSPSHLSGGLTHGEPELARIPLQTGDHLLLASTSVARDVGELLIAQALAHSDPSAALHELAPDVDYSALSVEPFATPTEKSSGAQPKLQAPLRRAEPPALRTPDKAPRPMHAFEMVRKPRPQPSFSAPQINLRPYFEVVVVTLLLILKFLWSLFSVFVGLLARALPASDRAPVVRTAQARRPVMQSSPTDNRVLVGLALAIPLLVLLGVVVVRNQTAIAQSSRLADVMAQAQRTYQSAIAIQNPDARKAELQKASVLVDEALSLAPRDQSVRDLQLKIQNELDKLTNVAKFFFYPLLYEFNERDSRPTAVIARGSDVYVLDSGLNRLYKFSLNEAKDGLQPTPTRAPTPVPTPNPILMRQGDERGTIVIGRLADIFWASAGSGRSGTGVLTLTASKQVVEYQPSKGINVLALGAAQGWKEATLGESFNGNLYLLDASANRILKYQATGEDYKNAPSDYLAPTQRVDFAGAVDMAVDGYVWVLLADGSILKFDSGNLLPFDKKGLETPLRKPVALVAQPNSQSIWIADAGNRRIVQLTKNGDLVRQLKPDDATVMSDLRGLAVDETNKRFYFVNGNRLYMGTLQN